jgi:formylglycine-generating enzyme required for sulfatase activity
MRRRQTFICTYIMDARFTSIVQKLIAEQGKDTLIDGAKCKAFLADYAGNEFKKERHLLMIALEAGTGREIAHASDLGIAKLQQIRFLNEDRFIDKAMATEVVDLLAYLLRGDRGTAATGNTPAAGVNPPPGAGASSAPPPMPGTSASAGASSTPPPMPSTRGSKSASRNFGIFAVAVSLALGGFSLYRKFEREEEARWQRMFNEMAAETLARQLASTPSPRAAPTSPSASAAKTPAPAARERMTNSIGMEFVLIPAGSFMMGDDGESAYDDEKPRHRVTISQPFYLGKYEVTQAQWTAVMGSNPSEFKGSSNPVENVSWNDVQEFIRRLNEKEGTQKYRLPTEAEWEYAARAGTTSRYSFGDDADSLDRYAWYRNNSGKKTQPVGRRDPNAWSLYDMHGNVWEWVEDWFDETYYARSPASDPRGPSGGAFRVLRGGSWLNDAGPLRSAYRSYDSPETRNESLGFRLAFSPGH